MFCLLTSLGNGSLSLWERIVFWYQNSLLREFLTYFNERYFTIEFGLYENFAVDSGMGTTVRNMILALALGIVIAAAMVAHMRNGLGDFVRKLLKAGAVSPESAKTLEELESFRHTAVRRDLARGSVLRMVVRCKEEEAWEQAHAEQAESGADVSAPKKKELKSGYRINFLTDHFYIPEDLRYRAEVRFERAGSGWLLVPVAAVLALITAALLCWLLPDVLQLADNLISFMSPN